MTKLKEGYRRIVIDVGKATYEKIMIVAEQQNRNVPGQVKQWIQEKVVGVSLREKIKEFPKKSIAIPNDEFIDEFIENIPDHVLVQQAITKSKGAINRDAKKDNRN
jgi:hypothetical protein